MLFYGENRVDSLLLSLACIIRKDYAKMLPDVVVNKKSSEKSGVFWPVCALFGTFCHILDYNIMWTAMNMSVRTWLGSMGVSSIGIMLISR
ncbi:hypothetical protein AALD74_24015 [Lachnospiraceae bacterium 48-21]|uniref:hypothetical protein n=1 Tax=Eubacterium sp. 14-2 TaxID=1235790 RepID=UPI0003A77FF6|nr:hypothetical protein [Eubacterium sp. 14-2]MCI8784704.1 hypothetical protein [Dorea sp.]